MLWNDFVTALRHSAIRTWSRATLIECKDLLTQRDVHVDPDRTRPADLIIAVLLRTEHIGSPNDDSIRNAEHYYDSGQRKQPATKVQVSSAHNAMNDKEINEDDSKSKGSPVPQWESQAIAGYRDGDSSNSSDENDDKVPSIKDNFETPGIVSPTMLTCADETTARVTENITERSRGVSTIIKAL